MCFYTRGYVFNYCTNMKIMQQTILLCNCESPEHQLVIYKVTDPIYGPEAYVRVHLVKRSFLYRLIYGIKYIFGYKSKYGAWDEFLINPDHVLHFEDLVNHLNNESKITV